MLTPYQKVIEKLKNIEDFDNVFLSWDHDRKERKKVEKMFSQQKC